MTKVTKNQAAVDKKRAADRAYQAARRAKARAAKAAPAPETLGRRVQQAVDRTAGEPTPKANAIFAPVVATQALVAPAPKPVVAPKAPRATDALHLADALNSRLEARLRRIAKAHGHAGGGKGPTADIRAFCATLPGSLMAVLPPRKEQADFEQAVRAAGVWEVTK